MKFVVFCMLFLGTFSLYSQSKKAIEQDIDSFKNYISVDDDKAIFFLQKAYKNSLQLKNDSLIARTSYNFGYVYYMQNNKAAKTYTQQAIQYSQKSKYPKILSLSYNQLGLLDTKSGNYTNALANFQKAYKVSEDNKLSDCTSKVLLNLGNLFVYKKDTAKSIYYYSKTIEVAKQAHLDNDLLKAQLNLAILFKENKPQNAIFLFKEALKNAQNLGDLQMQFDVHINLSDLYLSLDVSNHIQVAENHVNSAAQLQNDIQSHSNYFFLYFNKGGIFQRKNLPDEALSYYLMAKEHSYDNITQAKRMELHKILYELYEQKHDYQNALRYNISYESISDSIFNIESEKNFKEILTKYEVDKKNLQINLLSKQKQLEESNKNKILVILFAVILAFVLFIYFINHKIKTDKILVENKQKIEHISSILEGQNIERTRLAKELHDSLGSQLASIQLHILLLSKNNDDVHLETIAKQVSSVFSELRQISHNLNIDYITDHSLSFLLSELVQTYEKDFQVNIIEFPVGSLENLTNLYKQNLYRISQELFSNIQKHSKATVVTYSFTFHEDSINIMIEDNGVGFDIENIDSNGIGVNNIRDRVSLMKGTMELESTLGKGTTCILNLPYKK